MINPALWYIGGTPSPPETDKFVFSITGATYSASAMAVKNSYGDPSAEIDATAIETVFGIGSPGILELTVTYVRTASFFQEVIYVNSGSPFHFWNDILSWLYMKNVEGILYSSGDNAYHIEDSSNRTYILIQ